MSVKISELPSASSVTSSDVVPIVQGGTTKQANLGIVASAGGVPTNSIMQYDGNTIPTGYEEVNGFDNYSTTEHVVGTWIDGKPVYEITIVNYSVTLSNNSALIGQLNVSVDHFVSVDWAVGTPAAQNNAWRTGYLSSDYYSGVQVSMVNGEYNIYIFAKDSITNPIKVMATIRYTKSTDSAS